MRSAKAWEREQEQEHLATMADGVDDRWPVQVFGDRVHTLIN